MSKGRRRAFSRFEWVMAWRESRGSLKHFSFFLICIALGVAALVGVGSLSADLQSAIQRESRALMAGDLEIRSQHPLSSEALKRLQGLEERGIHLTTVRELIAMAASPDRSATQLVELKAVGADYPFYGRLETEPLWAVATLSGADTALVEESLLLRLGLQIGQPIRLGLATLRVAGVILSEPDRVAGAFSLGPRVMISQEALAGTGLIQPGSRVRHRTLLELPPSEDLEGVGQEVESFLADEAARIRSYKEAQPGLRRFLSNLTTYLALAGLTALLVGGAGVAISVSTFLRGKLDTLALLKCLGAGRGAILRIYLLQTTLLGLLGCLVGVVLGLWVERLLADFLSGLLPAAPDWQVRAGPIFKGVAGGMLTTWLFSLWPLAAVRNVPPARVFRRDFTPYRLEWSFNQRPSWGKGPWLTGFVFFGGLAALALWQAESLYMGGLFIGVLAVTVLLLWLGLGLTIRLIKQNKSRRSMTLRHGLAGLHRPGNQSLPAAVAMGVVVTVVLSLLLMEANLLDHIGENLPRDAPGFFFIDIQRDQRDSFESLMGQEGADVELTPIVRMRLHAVDGKKVSEMDLEHRHDAWYFHREYVVTTKEDLPRGNQVSRGQWWGTEEDPKRPLISVEEDAALHLGVDLGSSLVFDLQGVLVTAVVASIREVNWGNLSANFFIIFSPEALENAPTTFVATVRSNPDQDLSLQRTVVSVFPNVTAINVRHILEAVRRVLERIGLAIRFMAAFTVLAGLAVLASAIAATRHWRTRESVILKTLGATRAIVAKIFAVEYAVLGAMAGVVGAMMASLLAFLALRFFLEVPWQPQPDILLAGIAVTVAAATLTGFLTTYRILGKKPLAVLRDE